MVLRHRFNSGSGRKATELRWLNTPKKKRSKDAVNRITRSFARIGRTPSRERMIPLFETNLSDAEIARRVGVSRQMVYRVKKQLEIERPKYGHLPAKRKRTARKAIRTRWKRIPLQDRFSGNSKRVKDYIMRLLQEGVSPDNISPSDVFGALQGRVTGLNLHTVESVITRLHGLKILEHLSSKGRARLMRTARRRTKIASKEIKAITFLRTQKDALNGIGDVELFFDVLKELFSGKNIPSIFSSMTKKGVQIDSIDVASVAQKTALILNGLQRNNDLKEHAELRDALQETFFWKTYIDECRPILKKINSAEVNGLISTRLRKLGQKTI